MMFAIISYIFGFLSAVILIGLLNSNKAEERDNELQEAYARGYESGKDIGYNLGIESMSWRNKK